MSLETSVARAAHPDVGVFINPWDGRPQHWYESFRSDCLAGTASARKAYRDVKEAHAWVTRELFGCPGETTRRWILLAERKRLAAIAWELKRRWSL